MCLATQLKRPWDDREVGTPKTHRRFLGREDGTYGPIPAKRLNGMLGMPLSRTELDGLYCCGDSTFPGQVHPTSAGLSPQCRAPCPSRSCFHLAS